MEKSGSLAKTTTTLLDTGLKMDDFQYFDGIGGGKHVCTRQNVMCAKGV